MRKPFAIGAAVALALAGGASSVSAQPGSTTARCADLAGTTIPADVIGLPTTGGEVTGAQLVPATGVLGEHCRVDAALHPVDAAAPDVRLRVALPTTWNGKAMMFGGGGYNGTIPDVAGNVPFGYAVAHLTGHHADPDEFGAIWANMKRGHRTGDLRELPRLADAFTQWAVEA